jgi:hypothetical protein
MKETPISRMLFSKHPQRSNVSVNNGINHVGSEVAPILDAHWRIGHDASETAKREPTI